MEAFTIPTQPATPDHNELRNTQLAEFCSAIVPYPNPVQVRDAIRIQAGMIKDLKGMYEAQSLELQSVRMPCSWFDHLLIPSCSYVDMPSTCLRRWMFRGVLLLSSRR